jgi:predicted GNAT family N-acyltransferase
MTEWQSQLLIDEHDLSGFDCGIEGLNVWLNTQALRAQKSDTARTYVWTRPGDRRVAAYYSIAPTQVKRDEITHGLAGGVGMVPAYLLARLALDQSLRSQGLGSELLFDALDMIVCAARDAAGRLIVVDAIDDNAADFYRYHNFVPVKENPLRLVMKVSTARKALGVADIQVAHSDAAELVSMEWRLPDGSSVPVVVSPDEMRRLAARIGQIAAEQGGSYVQLDLRAVISEVLGRDPFGD